MPDSQQTVFIVDDEMPILDALTLLMKSVDLQVKTFSHAQEFMDAYNPEESGCLLLDIRMPDISGIEVQKYLKQKAYFLPVIFMTGHGDIPMAVDAIKNGAEDFIQKPFESDELLKKIQAALKKDKIQREYISDTTAFAAALQLLTPREKEIMDKMVAGDANKVIAADLGISQRTVEIHRSHIMQKTKMKSLAKLIKMALAMEKREKVESVL